MSDRGPRPALREKGGDADFYGYCVDDPVNRVDVWGLEGEEAKSNKPYYCRFTGECDEQNRISGSYKPIPGREDVPPFLLQMSPFDPIVAFFHHGHEAGWLIKNQTSRKME